MADIDLNRAIEEAAVEIGCITHGTLNSQRLAEAAVRAAFPHIIAALADAADAAIELGDSDATLEWLHAQADEVARG